MKILTNNKIKDIDEFCKLYKINIPIESEFEYYIDILKKSDEYKNSLSNIIEKFINLENWISEHEYKNIKEYKNKCLDALKDYIISTETYKNLQNAKLPGTKMISRDHLNQLEDGQILLSLDFKSANYNVLKTFSEEGTNELFDNWSSLCGKFDIHEALVNSKSFRQIVFGNTNPGRLQTFQKENMLKVMEYLKTNLQYTDEDFVFISHDELILKIQKASQVNKICENLDILSSVANKMEIRVTPFALSKLKKNTFVKTLYSIGMHEPVGGVQGFIDTSSKSWHFEPIYNSLHGVPGNKFYMYFKKYILHKELDERDLMYYNDGELCIWVDEDVKKNKKSLPHYDKPIFVVNLESAMKDYSYLWDQMTEIVPNLSLEEKRRIVEIVAGACKHCFKEVSGCQCWNDD